MVPSAIKKTLGVSAVAGVAGAGVWSYWDWRAGLTFVLAVAWAIGNVLIWTRLIQVILCVGRRRPFAVFGWSMTKVLMLAGGFGAVWVAAPLSVGQTIALTVGVFSVLFAATVLAFLGAFLERPSDSSPSAAGSHAGPPAAVAVFLMAGLILAGAYARASAPPPSASDAHSLAAASTATVTATHAGPSEPAMSPHEATNHGEVEASPQPEQHAAKPELPNIVTVLLQLEVNGKPLAETEFGHFLHTFEYQVFLVLITSFLCALVLATAGLRALIPGPTQALLEIIVEGFYNFFAGVLGSHERARRHMPFFGSIFLFIWFNNMFGIVPLFTGATSTFQLTASLAVLVFFYVHLNAIREAGFKHWFMHLLQDPKDVIGWVLAPVFFVLHVIGELAKPLSLSLRLFGNITGEHILSGVFLILGLLLMSAIWPQPWVGVPLHLPFLFLSLLVGTIQATVFTLLSTIYLALFLPHDEHDHGGNHAAEEAH
ncbi:MAG: F0F1 ATP synthase subunit A [Candidatus Sumerlaeaceae bacterium]|nr:F0F1 ATP synthase subunit A [Candidatus Sumerlaeaceae bacterium]